MRALTVRQPWAWAIAAGFKLVENRSQRTTHRGELAIHAGLTWSDRGGSDPRILGIAKTDADAVFRSRFPLGAVLAVADLVDVHPDVGCCRPWGESSYEEAGGVVRTSVWHYVFDPDVAALAEPVPCKGALGLWPMTDDVAALVRAQLAAAV